MADKKNLKGGVANLLGGSGTQDRAAEIRETIEDETLREELEERLAQRRRVGVGRPRTNTAPGGKRSDGYDRTSLIINVAKWAKVKEIALRETVTLKEIMEAALDIIIERYEAKHGEIKPQPRTKKDIKDIF